jgi:ribosomal protein S1
VRVLDVDKARERISLSMKGKPEQKARKRDWIIEP